MAVSAEDIVNGALRQIGFPRQIGDLYEGSPAARAALQVYGRTRDELLQQGDWDFARREVAPITAGQTPPSPWEFEYLYPDDCLRIRTLRPGPLTGAGRDNDPQPVLWSVWNDQRPATPVKAILADLGTVIVVYAGKVTNPAAWSPGFTRALIDALAQKLAFALAQSQEIVRARVALAEQSKNEGLMINDTQAPALPSMPTQPQR